MFIETVKPMSWRWYSGTETCDFLVLLKRSRRLACLGGCRDRNWQVGDQFKDAFNFAQSMIQNPDAKITVAGHSLGGGLTQAVGATLGLETFALNSSPVPDHFFDTNYSSL